MADDPVGGFDLGIDFAVGSITLRVHGEVDALTAPLLSAVLVALVEQRLDEVVLDLGELEFMDASGLGVLADVSARLATSGRFLTVRSAPPMTLRILEITRVNEIVRLDGDHPEGTDSRQVGPRSANAFVDAALRAVTVLASATVEGADGVSVTLERHGHMTTVASSDDTVLRMDHHQYETGEGPCLAAAAHGHWFHSESLAEETRWPAFVPLAMQDGIASILSTPLISAGRSIGALNIYSRSERAFGPDQQELAGLFASQAVGILRNAATEVDVNRMDERFADALLAREAIAQAQGMLMSRQHLDAPHAATALYRAARTEQMTVRDHAVAIVASAHIDNESET